MTAHRRPWDLHDPAATIATMLERSGVTLGQTVVAHVDLASQQVTGTRVVETPCPTRHDGSEAARADRRLSERAREIAESLGRERCGIPGGQGWEVPDSVLITLVCRPGRVVTTARETQWARAWLYANHLTNSFSGEVYLITPHGWAAASGDAFGTHPRMGDVPSLRVV